MWCRVRAWGKKLGFSLSVLALCNIFLNGWVVEVGVNCLLPGRVAPPWEMEQQGNPFCYSTKVYLAFRLFFFSFHRFPYFILSFFCQVERVGCGTEVMFPKKCISDWALLLCLLVSWFRKRSFDKDLDQLPWHLGLYFRHNPYRLQYSHWPSVGTEKYIRISKDDGDFLIT